MVQNPPEGCPRVTPYLTYEDADRALEDLAKCFGFEQTTRLPGPDGKAAHAEMKTGGDGLIMLGAPGAEFGNPTTKGYPGAMVHVYVDDIERHYETARAAGAKITEELQYTFYGDRRYMAEDHAGHRWAFAEHVKDVAPEDFGEWWKEEA